jgi:hypothetical protein
MLTIPFDGFANVMTNGTSADSLRQYMSGPHEQPRENPAAR